MSYTIDIRNALEKIKKDPSYHRVPPNLLSPAIINEITRSLIDYYQKHPEGLYAWTEDIVRISISDLEEKYQELLSAGNMDLESIKRLLTYSLLSHKIHVVDYVELSDSDRFFWFILTQQEYQEINTCEYEHYLYALNNHLCYYKEQRWIITSLGNSFLRLPELQATRYLLSLETYLAAGDNDLWHMPRSYLQKLNDNRSISFEKEYFTYDFEVSPPDAYAFRVREMGLVSTSETDPKTLVTTSLGNSFIESVIEQDSIFDMLIPLYVREELIGSGASQYTNRDDLERLKNLLELSPIAGEQKEPILIEVERLFMAEEKYLSIFKSLAPCVEGLLRNLLKKEQIQVEGTGLYAYRKAIAESPGQILSHGTLDMIDAVFRPFRNIVEHGQVIAAEPARMLCEITLALIEQIHVDYYELKEGIRD